MENHDIGWIATLLEGHDHQTNCSELMADRIIELFSEAEKKLSSIIGLRGLSKLHHANISKIAMQYSWLSAAIENPDPSLKRVQLLRSVLVEQTAVTSKQAGLALLQGFYSRLVTLIGLAVTEILLRSVWETSSAKYARGL
ncbi:hypothetical protein PO883_22285 [Massilia sp. DJPM01]|uniref:hypothetical protein n=1 Tax=Massilia sp. DJPM01 TaxID=3024404 RepID=UPI00259F7AB5|nr:hypothetical protein [Massilia sp. DJPM01]MDM5179925.1 hypothetical protein [Massilia sp. DJPM01]